MRFVPFPWPEFWLEFDTVLTQKSTEELVSGRKKSTFVCQDFNQQHFFIRTYGIYTAIQKSYKAGKLEIEKIPLYDIYERYWKEAGQDPINFVEIVKEKTPITYVMETVFRAFEFFFRRSEELAKEPNVRCDQIIVSALDMISSEARAERRVDRKVFYRIVVPRIDVIEACGRYSLVEEILKRYYLRRDFDLLDDSVFLTPNERDKFYQDAVFTIGERGKNFSRHNPRNSIVCMFCSKGEIKVNNLCNRCVSKHKEEYEREFRQTSSTFLAKKPIMDMAETLISYFLKVAIVCQPTEEIEG